MTRIATIWVAVLIVWPALAAAAPAPGAGAVTVERDGQVRIASPPCAALGAGADYVPGVDVDGNAVAPADLPRAAPAVTADGPSIAINAQLAGRFGVPTGSGYRAKATLGYVTVRDGRVYFNGQPLAPDASAAMIAACTAARK